MIVSLNPDIMKVLQPVQGHPISGTLEFSVESDDEYFGEIELTGLAFFPFNQNVTTQAQLVSEY